MSAAKELRLGLARLRAAITHVKHASSLNPMKPSQRGRVEATLLTLHLAESEICRDLGAAQQ